MKRPMRLALAALSGIALLAACDRGIVSSRSADGATIRLLSPDIDQPIDDGGGGGVGDDGGGGGGGGTGGGSTGPGPFSPPPPPYYQAPNLPNYLGGSGGVLYSCGQITHPIWSIGNTFDNDIPVGTTIYVSGVVVPGTKMNWGIYDQWGNQVRTHLTQPARSNCVVHHEPEYVSTYGLAPGYYYLYASYNGITGGPGSIYETSYGYAAGFTGKYVGPLRLY